VVRVGEITTVLFSVALVSRGTSAVSAVADVFFIGAGRNFDIWISASVRITLCLAEELFSSLAVVMTNRRHSRGDIHFEVDFRRSTEDLSLRPVGLSIAKKWGTSSDSWQKQKLERAGGLSLRCQDETSCTDPQVAWETRWAFGRKLAGFPGLLQGVRAGKPWAF